MRVGYLECFAGISGDMLMSAMVDAGAPFEVLAEAAASLGLGAELRLSKVDRSGIQASKIDVLVDGKLAEAPAGGSHDHPHLGPHSGREEAGHPHHQHDHDHQHDHAHEHGGHGNHAPGRNLAAIRGILSGAPLSRRAKALALHAFELLGEAEARIHGASLEQVHFHEAGAVDAIVDIACCATAIDALALDGWYSSPVNVGSGFVNCAHGRFPVPAPATADLLKNIPVYSAGPEMELATPTGAALLRALNCRFESVGVMRSGSIGYGAGSRNPERFPNVLRLTLGEIAAAGKFNEERVTVMECAIDDLSPQVLAHTAQLALERGALDVMSAPVTMKKGRMGTLLTVLARPADAGDLEELLFRQTSTLGMRVREENRVFLVREIVPVETEFGVIRVKAGFWQGEELNAAPEFEDCRRAAEAFDAPLKAVIQAALAGWRRGAPFAASIESGQAAPQSGTRSRDPQSTSPQGANPKIQRSGARE